MTGLGEVPTKRASIEPCRSNNVSSRAPEDGRGVAPEQDKQRVGLQTAPAHPATKINAVKLRSPLRTKKQEMLTFNLASHKMEFQFQKEMLNTRSSDLQKLIQDVDDAAAKPTRTLNINKLSSILKNRQQPSSERHKAPQDPPGRAQAAHGTTTAIAEMLNMARYVDKFGAHHVHHAHH